MKTKIKTVLLAAVAVIAALLAGCTKQEAPAVRASAVQPAPAESAANITPAPETPEAVMEPPAADPVQQAPADKLETAPTVAVGTVPAPVQQPPAKQPEPAAAAVSSAPLTPTERAKQHLDRNEFDQAIAAYTEIIRLNPGDADAYYNRGDAYYGKGDMDRASADWNEAIRLNSGYAVRLGQNPVSGAAEAAVRAQEAAETMDKALQSNPNYTRAQDALDRLQGAFDF